MKKKSDISNDQLLKAIEKIGGEVVKNRQLIKQNSTDIADLNSTVKAFVDYSESKFDSLDNRLDKVDNRFDKVDYRLDSLENGQSNILSRLSDVAYKFEVRDLEKRVEALETK